MFIFGPDVRSLFLTIFLVVAPVAFFCVFVARHLMNDFSNHLGISIMVVAVAFTIYVGVLHSPFIFSSMVSFANSTYCFIVFAEGIKHFWDCVN
jgi:hypothetical protein